MLLITILNLGYSKLDLTNENDTWTLRFMASPQKSSKTAFFQDISIPSPPQILAELEALQGDIDAFVNRIVQEPALGAQLLMKVNAPYYGLKTQIASIPQSIMLLGVGSILNIVRSMELRKMTNKLEPLFVENFWQNSMLVALVCQMIAKKVDAKIKPEEAYTLGLFHNCGIPLILERSLEFQTAISASYAQTDGRITEYEEKHHAFNHAMIGCLIARSWHLPAWLCECIRDHHNLKYFCSDYSHDNHEHVLKISLLKLAEHTCSLYRYLGGQNEDHEWNAIKPMVIETLGFSDQDYQQFMDELTDLLEGLV